jgi:hypothetical protein
MSVWGTHSMRRFLVLAVMLAPAPGQALDCGKLVDGRGPFSGASTVKNGKTGSTERFAVGIERGAHTLLKMRSSAAGTPEIINEFDRGQIGRWCGAFREKHFPPQVLLPFTFIAHVGLPPKYSHVR